MYYGFNFFCNTSIFGNQHTVVNSFNLEETPLAIAAATLTVTGTVNLTLHIGKQRVSGQSPPTVRTECPVYTAASAPQRATTHHSIKYYSYFIEYIVNGDSIEAIQTI